MNTRLCCLPVVTDNIYLQINTWAFPYWPGYHPETPILARDTWGWTQVIRKGRQLLYHMWHLSCNTIYNHTEALYYHSHRIWKCPCIKLFITYFRHLEKRHPYWPETKALIWKWSCSNPITGYFPGVWKYGQFTSGHISHTKMPLFELSM
jgi:hypothetical protein